MNHKLDILRTLKVLLNRPLTISVNLKKKEYETIPNLQSTNDSLNLKKVYVPFFLRSSSLFTTKSSGLPVTHLIDLGRMKS